MALQVLFLNLFSFAALSILSIPPSFNPAISATVSLRQRRIAEEKDDYHSLALRPLAYRFKEP
ncbi:MAG: hypothetical protein M1117_05675, partial [Candidatus Thermoplasmatota archaeon]|nr:hypothetical protein [Candidatus Thermoplasmatota archaeon]